MAQHAEPGAPVEQNEQDEDGRVEVDSTPVEAVESSGLVPVEADRTQAGPVEGALMAAPALVLLVANSTAMTAATAFHAGGTGGLVGTAAVAGGGAVVAGAIRRAHRAETARRQQAEQARTGRTPAGAVPDPRTRRQAVRDARRAGSAPGARPGSVLGRAGGTAGRAGGVAGRAGGTGTGAGARGRGGRGGPVSGLRSLAAGTPARGGARSGATVPGRPGSAAGGRPSGARAGITRAPGSGFGGAAAGRGTGTGRGGRFGVSGRGGGGAGRPGAGRGVGAVTRSGATGLGAGRGAAARMGSAGRGAAARVGSAGRSAAAGLGAVRRAGAAGSGAVGRGTHAVAGSGPSRRAGAAARRTSGMVARGAATGRAVAGAVKTARTPVAAARAARAAIAKTRMQQGKNTARVQGRLGRFRAWVAAALIAVAAGGWVAGRGTLRALWARLRSLVGAGAATPTDPEEVADSFDDPDDRRRPGSRAGQPFTTKGYPMVTKNNIFQGPAEAAYANAVAYQPEGMLDFLAQMETLRGPLTQFSAAVLLLAAKASDEFPLDKSIGELLGQIGTAMGNAARSADEIYPQIRRMHAPELARLEAPRTGERLWDTGENPQ